MPHHHSTSSNIPLHTTPSNPIPPPNLEPYLMTIQMRYDLRIAYGILAGLEATALILPIPVPVHMLIITATIIYIACHHAASNTKDQNDSSDLQPETMRRSDVYMFPIIGSCVLFSLYLTFKIFPRWLMLSLFKFYFMLGGVWTVAKRIHTIIIGCVNEEKEAELKNLKVSIPLQKVNETIRPVVVKINNAKAAMTKALEPAMPYLSQVPKALAKVELFMIEKFDGPDAAKAQELANKEAETTSTAPPQSPANNGTTLTASTNEEDWFPDLIVLDGPNAVSYGSAIIVAVMYLVTNHWIFNNIFGISFSIQAIELINLGSYVNGAILLCGLFFYDIFWVFGTEVMVTVAKGVDAPIKLLFPRGDSPAMLGLGDIVIPGIFIALMLRYDMFLANQINHRNEKDAKLGPVNAILNKIGALSFINISTDYFNLVLIGYILGLVTTVGIMFFFQAAQPALLYLVPACLLSTAGVAAILGQQEFNSLVNFNDTPSETVPKSPEPTVPAPQAVE